MSGNKRCGLAACHLNTHVTARNCSLTDNGASGMLLLDQVGGWPARCYCRCPCVLLPLHLCATAAAPAAAPTGHCRPGVMHAVT